VPEEIANAEAPTRRVTRQVHVGAVAIGGGAPVAVQSMANTPPEDAEACLAQIERLTRAGCEIVRLAVPNQQALPAFARIVAESPLPVVADIQFSADLAVRAIEAGAAKVRINPGNIGGEEKVRRVADAAKAAGIPIRVGVNAGSLSPEMLEKHGGPSAAAMVESAIAEARTLEKHGFEDLVVALKASDVARTVAACRLFAVQSDLPLHLGVTEAGPLRTGTVKSAVALTMLLGEGIGDTLRVSLTAPPEEEVRVAWEILRALGIRRRGVAIVSCPTCARCRVDLVALTGQVSEALQDLDLPITVAVMGCIVNGPGEAREADVALCAEEGGGVLTRKGELVRRVGREELLEALLDEVRKLAEEAREQR
jgi:(E)-4-hydroxy-3-methylbut-2-enyl-diphosphate synthase